MVVSEAHHAMARAIVKKRPRRLGNGPRGRYPRAMARRLLTIALVLVALAWVRPYVPGLHTANEYARLYATLAMAEYGTAKLEPVFDRFAPAWRDTGTPPNSDVAKVGDSYYLDKAPLPSLVAVPVHLLLREFFDTWAHPDGEVAILAALFGALPLLVFLGLAIRRDAPVIDAAALLLAVGSPLLVYAGLWFGHLTAGLAAYAGYALLKRERPFWGGLLLGAAVLCDYPAAAISGVVLGVHVVTRRPDRGVLLALGGFALAAVVQLAYNAILFGDPLTFAYAHKAAPEFQRVHATGLLGVTWPTRERLGGILLSPARGLLFVAPLFLLALPGAVLAAREGALPWRERLLPLALLVAVPPAVAGFVDWKAGNCTGPRHLVSLLPFLVAPAAAGVQWLASAPRLLVRAIPLTLGAIGVVHTWLAWSTFPYLSTQLANPLLHQALPLFLDGCRAATWLPVPSVAGAVIAVVIPVLVVLAAGEWLGEGLSGRARLGLAGLALLVALLASAGLALIGAGAPDEAAIAGREASMVQSLRDCQRTPTATDLVKAFGPATETPPTSAPEDAP